MHQDPLQHEYGPGEEEDDAKHDANYYRCEQIGWGPEEDENKNERNDDDS